MVSESVESAKLQGRSTNQMAIPMGLLKRTGMEF